MSDDDFDIDGLARFLHLTPAQVTRMAERGKLPGRRISGRWRFAPAEIHHWLEDRIGVSGEGELMQVEGVLDRSKGAAGEQTVSIEELLPVQAVGVPLAARTRSSVIVEMVDLAMGTGRLWDPGKMAMAVRAREKLHPTALDNGVALLHPRRPLASVLQEAVLALGRTSQGIPFGGGGLTDIFFLICSTDDRGHLRVLARLSRLLSDAALLTSIRRAADANAVHELIIEQEHRIYG